MTHNSPPLAHRTLLLIIIFAGFISLGLPDSVLGVAWPKMQITFDKPTEAGGILPLVCTLFSAAAGIFSGFVLARLGTGLILALSAGLTSIGLLGYTLAPQFWWLVAFAIPLGIGAGCVDAGLNGFVARHYSSREMSWLHCCWGIGATGGPAILTAALFMGGTWRNGYTVITLIQSSLTLTFFLTLRYWGERKIPADEQAEKNSVTEHASCHALLRNPAAWCSIIGFFCYVGIETSVGFWGAKLLESRGMEIKQAGLWVTLYWASLTVGRFGFGIIADRLGNRRLVSYTLCGAIAGAVFLALPSTSPWLLLPAFALLGAGLGPYYPCQMHETPRRFNPAEAQTLIGWQVGAACLGIAALPPLFGLLGSRVTFNLLPLIYVFFLVVILVLHTVLNQRTKTK